MRSRVRVKICCISSAEEARLAVAAGADALGFVAAMPSGPGIVSDEVIRTVVPSVPPAVSTFLLTSFSKGAGDCRHVATCATSTVQIVDHIDPAEHVAMAALMPAIRRVQVIHVQGLDALDMIPVYEPMSMPSCSIPASPAAPCANSAARGAPMTGTSAPNSSGARGGRSFLAGGLNPDNAAEAIQRVKPFGLDLCSGLRTDGHLDPAKLAAFMRAVREAS